MIVGLLGFIGSGKGTAGDILKDMGFTPVSFAKGVKDVAAEMFGWDRILLEGDSLESREFRETPCKFWSKKFGRDFTPREALQKMGTEVGRDTFHSDFWILQLENRMKDYDKPIVITDVRFPNEIEWIHNMGGSVYEIKRGVQPIWCKYLKNTDPVRDRELRWSFMSDYDVHYSEWAWVGCKTDGVIKNNGTLEDLTELLKFVIID